MRDKELWCVCLVWGLSLTVPATRAETASEGLPSQPKVVLENELVQATIDRDKGAGLSSFVEKRTGRELLAGPSFLDCNILVGGRMQGLGQLKFDLAGESPGAGDKLSCELSAALTEDVPNEGEHLVGRAWDVIVWHPREALKDHPFELVKLTKRYRLRPGSAVLTVEYELHNTGKEPVKVCLGTSVSLAGNRLCVPTREGPVAIDLPLQVPDERKILRFSGGDSWLYDTPGAWTAKLSKDGGAVANFDPRHVSFLRVNPGRPDVLVARTRAEIAAGGVFRTSAWSMPVQGVVRVQDTAPDMAVSFRVTPEKADGSPPLFRRSYTEEMLKGVTMGTGAGAKELLETAARKGEDEPEEDLVETLETEAKKAKTGYQGKPIQVQMTLFSWRDVDAQVAFRVRPAARGESQELGGGKQALKAGQPASLETSFKPGQEGTYVVEAEVTDGGKPVSRFECPLIAGRPKRYYLPAVPQKDGEVNMDFYYAECGRPDQPLRCDWQPTRAYESPHAKIAYPLAGGPLKALIVTPYIRARDAVELAQRIQLDTDMVVQIGWDKEWNIRTLAPLNEVDQFRRFLSKPHEVFIFGYFMGQKYPLDVMEEVLRQVEEEGVGLVISMGRHFAGALAEHNAKAQPDEQLFPGSTARIVQAGKGRIAFLDGTPLEVFSNWVTLDTLGTEKDYESFAELLMWASGRDTKVALKAAGLKRTMAREALRETPLTVSVENRGGVDFQGKLRVIARKDLCAEYPYYSMVPIARRQYPSSEDWLTLDKPVKVGAGKTEETAVSVGPVPTGFYSLLVSVLDAKDATVTWKRLPLSVTSETHISGVTVSDSQGRTADVSFAAGLPEEQRKASGERDRRFFTADQGDTITVETVCAGKGGPWRLEAIAWDPWQRLVFQGESKGVAAGGKTTFRIPLQAAYHRILELKVRLHEEGGCVQERRLLGFIQPRLERVPAFGWITYSPDSDIRPEITQYDSRHRGFVAMDDIIRHAWCNMNMTGLTDALPMAYDIILPGDEGEKTVEMAVTNTLETEKEDEPDTETELFGKKIDYKKGYIRVPCLMDPRFRKAISEDRENYFRTRGYFCRPFNVTMGDEFYYTKELVDDKVAAGFRRQFILSRDGNICRCQHCLKAFSEFAKKLYNGDLSALNQEWSAEYKSWDKVDPPLLSRNRVKVSKTFKYIDPSTSDSSQEETCPPEEKWPHVLDHRRFIDYQVAEAIAELRAAARRGCPSSKLGWGDLMGDTSMWNGLDAYLLAPHMDFNGLDHEINIWRSLGHPDNSHFVGYAKQYSTIRESTIPWYMMFEGNTNIGNWNSFDYPKYREDFTFYEGPLVIFKTMAEIRNNGFDRLLVGHRYNDPVAILYDTRSIYISEMQEWKEDQPRFFAHMAIGSRSHNDTCKQVEQTYAALLAGHQLQYYTVGYGHLEDGHFGRFGTPKMLFLPFTQCISAKQAATLEKFVQEGGILVGDVHTGFRDEHGERLKTGNLNHVFGIKQTAWDGMRTRRDSEGKPIAVRFGKECGGPFSLGFEAVGPGDVEATSAKAYAKFMLNGKEQPAFLVNELGKGKAIYLDFLPSGYHEVVGDVTEGDEAAGKDFHGAATGVKTAKGDVGTRFRALFETILKLGGLEDPVVCEGSPGIYRFGEGEVEFLGLDGGYKYPPRWRRPYQIQLRSKRHVYDARDGRYLGFSDTIDARFDEDTLKMDLLYSLLPYKVEGLQVQLDSTEVQAGKGLTFSVQVLPEAAQRHRHVISFRVINPKGEDIRWYSSCLQTVDGFARGRIDFAQNDLAGVWTLSFRDAATGTKAEATFTVK